MPSLFYVASPLCFCHFAFSLSRSFSLSLSRSLSLGSCLSLSFFSLPPCVCHSRFLSVAVSLCLYLALSGFLPSLSRSLSLSFSRSFSFSVTFSLSCRFFFISRQLSGSVTFAVSDSRALLRGLSDVPLGFNFDIEENANFRDFKRATVYPSAAGL